MSPTRPHRTGAPLDSYAIEAPAKVNLYLDVLGSRPDGYHEIDTVMQTVNLTDVLELRLRPQDEAAFSVSGRADGVPTDDSNLVMKAAKLLERHAGGDADPRTADVASVETTEIRLHKRIPWGAGLGGASSDAAATLVGLTRLWGLRVTEDDLLALAAEVGSDVPFFIRGGTSRCSGRGERVQPLRVVGELHLVLIFSAVHLCTAEIYRLWDRSHLTAQYPSGTINSRVESPLYLDALARRPVRNSLQEAAFAACPELRDVTREVLDAGAGAAGVSGSGSCVFGTADSAVLAERMAETLGARGREAVAASSVGPRDL